MDAAWQLRVYDSGNLVHEADLTGVAEIGRQKQDEKSPGGTVFRPWHYQAKGGWRVVIASPQETSISRDHLQIKPIAEDRLLMTNKSTAQVVGLQGRMLDPGTSSEVTLPVLVQLGNKSIRLQSVEHEEFLQSLPDATMAPGAGSLFFNMQAAIARSEGPPMRTEQLVAWIRAFVGLLHSAAGSADFFSKAAHAIVDLVKLDSGRVLIYAGGNWQEQAVQHSLSSPPESAWRPSNRILAGVLREKKTFWQIPDFRADLTTGGLDAVVAAPILGNNGEVIGALYGERRQTLSATLTPISQVEAMLVEVLASGVAAGLARVEQERTTSQMRTQMEQFFTPALAGKLERRPELLQGRDTEVSVLICDIRGFSRISERLGSARTVEWISDVMSDLSQCVLDHQGVVVDYIGDEMMAMWGAPDDQPDHAILACRAGLEMIGSLPKMNERWQTIIQEPLDLGIGINTGIAQVGNVGSRVKFKYGALGNTVNLASRVQGATKYLKTQLLITDSTRASLGFAFSSRRLCQVRVVNIVQPVTLFELVASETKGWADLKRSYEQALDEFNKGEFRQACRILGSLILDHPNDGPSLLLLSRAVAYLVEEPDVFDPVMVLSGK